jgi:DNA-binding MarR family transcriptional regulator
MTRTQWRVLAHLGKFGAMTARDICARSHIEKTKVSRAVAALEAEGCLTRNPSPQDRRAEILSLTDRGQEVFADLGQRAIAYDRALRDQLGPEVSARIDQPTIAAIRCRHAPHAPFGPIGRANAGKW